MKAYVILFVAFAVTLLSDARAQEAFIAGRDGRVITIIALAKTQSGAILFTGTPGGRCVSGTFNAIYMDGQNPSVGCWATSREDSVIYVEWEATGVVTEYSKSMVFAATSVAKACPAGWHAQSIKPQADARATTSAIHFCTPS